MWSPGRHTSYFGSVNKVGNAPLCKTAWLTSIDSDMARDAFATFIPISVESDARTKIIFDFFDLMSAIAAHGKTNGMSGGKLSRLAGWWAFEHVDSGNGFDGGYRSWTRYAQSSSAMMALLTIAAPPMLPVTCSSPTSAHSHRTRFVVRMESLLYQFHYKTSSKQQNTRQCNHQ